MADRKLSKRGTITVRSGQKYLPRHSTLSDPIYTEEQEFVVMHAHRDGSTRPRGTMHKPIASDQNVCVRWLWTAKNEYFAPELRYRPSREAVKLAKKIAEALMGLGWDHGTPDRLIEALKATVVEYIDDRADGCWDDYRVVRAPGDSDMMVIARAAV